MLAADAFAIYHDGPRPSVRKIGGPDRFAICPESNAANARCRHDAAHSRALPSIISTVIASVVSSDLNANLRIKSGRRRGCFCFDRGNSYDAGSQNDCG